MTRILGALAVAAIGVVPAAGRPDDDSDNVPVFALTTTPAPVPALRYEFVPRATERTRGDAAPDYARAVGHLPPWPADAAESRTLDATLSRWAEVPAAAFPVAAVSEYLKQYEAGFAALDAAALRDYCDWPPTTDFKDVPKLRQVAWLNLLRVLRDLARDDFDAAAGAIRSGLRLAKRTGERPNAARLSVGIAFQSIAWGSAVRLVGRPGSPNLYWALAALPRPLIDIRPGLDGDAAALDAELPHAGEFEKGPAAADAADRAAPKLYAAAVKRATVGPPPAPPGAADIAARVAKAAPAARAFLIEHGRTAADVKELPPAQAVVLAVSHARREFREELFTAFLRPFPQVGPEVERIERRAAGFGAALGDPLLAGVVSPEAWYASTYRNSARVERQFALLGAVEAIRLHAAAHAGRPPARLADVTAVPVPVDPYTGRPFGYAARPDGFALTAPPPAGEPARRVDHIRFEVSFRG